MRFENKRAIVTGAASGIGRAVAERLAREGATVLLCDWNREGVAAAAAAIGGSSGSMTLDVSNAGDCDAAVAGAADRWGGLDILCNIAGVLDFAPFADLTPDRWARVIGVNLSGVYNMSRAAMPHLVASRGTIVNMASAAGLVGVPFNAAYTASKHGVVGLTKALALEFSKQGVRINSVCPTGVRTPMVMAPPPDDIDWPAVMRSAPWLDDGAMCEPEDIADAVAFLASSEARRITGIAFPVDGGQTAG
jgi:meso-butanediol dehydrogenase / (S,S)-butanediol dehydrogenase / diacetyl reductase